MPMYVHVSPTDNNVAGHVCALLSLVTCCCPCDTFTVSFVIEHACDGLATHGDAYALLHSLALPASLA